MDFLLILLVAWALYTVYKSIKAGAYIYIAYLIVFYLLLGLFMSGPKLRIFLAVGLASLFNAGMIISNMMATLSKISSSPAKST
jgi:hypothetical protein